jgi:cytochrome P450
MVFAKPHLGATECLTRDEMVTLKGLVKEAVKLAGHIYAGDFIPLLDIYDFTGHKAKTQKLAARMFKIAMELIEKHKSKDTGPNVDADKLNLVDILLSQQGEEKLPDHAMAAILFDFIIAGSDTTSVSIEWALAELLHYPHYVKRAQEELDAVVGKDRVVDETDIKNMPFLQAVVKELFRLHPAAPLGIPHFNMERTTLAGYDIPARTTVMLNLWAIGRDPAFWKDPEEFKPERFLEGAEITMMGRDFQLIPFSVGRRQCPGAGLGLAVVQLAVASLLHAFEWQTCAGQKVEDIDMREKPGLVTPRMSDLVLQAVPRLPVHVYQGAYSSQNGSH